MTIMSESNSELIERSSRPQFNWKLWAYKNRFLVLEVSVILGYLLVTVFGPFFIKTDPNDQILSRVRESPNAQAILGRDELGRDILTRLVYGARYTVGIGFATVMFGLLLGGSLGLIAGYYGKYVDSFIMRVMDFALVFPSILLAIVLIAVLGTGLSNVIIAVGITFIPLFARLLRAQTMRLREEQYILAAQAIGVRDSRIILKHILPNAMPIVYVQSTYALGEAIITVAGLGFLGLGVQPPNPEWGVMLSRAREVLFDAPHVVIMPGMALLILLLTVNMLGDALRDITDPWLRGSR